MNEIRPRRREDEEIARIREIVGRHALPEFVTGFEVRLGDYEGEPAMWVTFHTAASAGEMRADQIERRVEAWRTLRDAVQLDLLDNIEPWFPHFRLEPANAHYRHQT